MNGRILCRAGERERKKNSIRARPSSLNGNSARVGFLSPPNKQRRAHSNPPTCSQ
ncbi:Hypothetical predicted protein, partial [Olea europaea subsp. europaea]